MEIPEKPTSTVGPLTITVAPLTIQQESYNRDEKEINSPPGISSRPPKSQVTKQQSEKTTSRADSNEVSFTHVARENSFASAEPRGTVNTTGKTAKVAHPPKRHYNTSRTKTTKATKNGAPRESHVEDPSVTRMYDSIPLLEVTKLPRGGLSIETEAVGRVQFGLPPETIKDSMAMGLDVPLYYIVPVERFCREMGPALGVNLAEFEFPAYFNFFIQKARCTLIVDSDDAERNIRRVFSETLLGPAQFRQRNNPIRFDPEDFAPDFNPEAIPDFEKELKHFRVMPSGEELIIETLLDFCHFEQPSESRTHENLGVPPSEPVDVKPAADKDMLNEKKPKPSAYSRIKLCAEVAVIYSKDATPKDKANKTCKRVELFKLQSGEEYIMHDIDENNIITGKIRFSGNLRVSESMSVHGFGDDDADEINDDNNSIIPKSVQPPTFHPPSFGVTVLGNSHGFDKSGSVSGYVLWINGRGVMIDPPPYSSFTLEREGIRPRTIVGIILTHCHADHDAGAFQKVLTGSQVVVITTPTIYKSFIRKYAALSNLSPALLRHSHRHKPAIIGAPLRFQGATFHFTYTLHSIPCVGFRVEWRGRSMVFTGDHFNSPSDIDKLQESGVLAEARANDLRNLPLQDTDLLLHEAGVPPLHTPLDVLLKLPKEVKERLYVVHTQALPPGCELRVAPVGTAGTIRLDEKDVHSNSNTVTAKRNTSWRPPFEEELAFQSMWSSSEYESSYNEPNRAVARGSIHRRKYTRSSIHAFTGKGHFEPPRVALRPTSSTDAWFTLNLLSAVPFLSGLSYASTMEVLETARVDAFCINEVVVHSSRRSEVLCVVWEGTCTERPVQSSSFSLNCNSGDEVECDSYAVWHAGDWTGPVSLQPERHLSGESDLSRSHDVVAMSQQGVKAITIDFASLHRILKNGSLLFRTYLERKKEKEMAITDEIPEFLEDAANPKLFLDAVRNLEILELLEDNTALRKLSAVQKRHLESLAEGPKYYSPGDRLWRSGAHVENAFIIVGGTASFIAKRRNAGSAAGIDININDRSEFDVSSSVSSIGEIMRRDCNRVVEELTKLDYEEEVDNLSVPSSISTATNGQGAFFEKEGDMDVCVQVSSQDSFSGDNDYDKLSIGLLKRAENFGSGSYHIRRDSVSSGADVSHNSAQSSNSEGDDAVAEHEFRNPKMKERRRSSRDRNVNRQLHRLYKGRAFTAGLVFSRGHFLGDISKMVAGLLSTSYQGKDNVPNGDDKSARYGFGEKNEGSSNPIGGDVGELTIHEQEGDQHIVHSSTLSAGKDGCVVLVFRKPSLISFLDEYPGLLLSLLGTQVVL